MFDIIIIIIIIKIQYNYFLHTLNKQEKIQKKLRNLVEIYKTLTSNILLDG
jgi:hypothetical protein